MPPFVPRVQLLARGREREGERLSRLVRFQEDYLAGRCCLPKTAGGKNNMHLHVRRGRGRRSEQFFEGSFQHWESPDQVYLA